MKKLSLTLTAFLGSLLLMQAQGTADDIYQRYSSGEGVFSMSLNHDLLDAIDTDFEYGDQLKHISGDIYGIKFITFSEEARPGQKVKEISDQLLKTELREIPLPKEADEEEFRYLRFFGEKEGGYYKNVYLLLLSDEGNLGLFMAVNGKLKIRKAS